jgi:hypothetical protein
MVKALVTRQSPDPRQLSFKEGDHIVLFKLRNPDITAKTSECVGYLNGVKGTHFVLSVQTRYLTQLYRLAISTVHIGARKTPPL